ncbi:8693089b-b5d5-4d07-bcc9-8a37df8755d3 [Thermothielavioides terrestris]|jgi:hypothetical protein|uniref:Cupin 2 conserved barrel domain-containing protein n=2 Tax=Thermothielavioides terrestris TaxID=2587410 RepID=G2R8E0_THETT|nr:uncharacterized protein THITE_2117629 [Thermothielavioides terrestris NRRL 8126]AEO68198.1 hypothetical protein THITE_2117629 [Thermothielavioides terrestris NRRL 8126]SPQ24558.1 8693089b-b5d5-4d07-bcc9-8a37df8755d3 [Thermothielavioides terrestris]
MADSQSSAPLPDPNRYITDTNAEGKAVFSSAVEAPVGVTKDLGGALARLSYVTPGPAPINLNGGADVRSYATSLSDVPPLVPPGGGTIVWYIDTPPNTSSPMHRTVSFDLVIQIEGEVELHLDGGESRLLRPGDMTVQRSTMHMWRNPHPTRWSRMVGIMTECQPVVVNGETLGTSFPARQG